MADINALLLDLQTGRISRRTFVSRSLAMGLSFSTASALLAACGAGSSSTGGNPKALSYATDATDTTEHKVIQDIINTYQKKSGTKVTVNFVPGADYPSAARTYLSSNIPPDVLAYYGGYLAQFFISRGLILDISDLWEKNNWTSFFPQGFQKISTGKDGKFYFLPQSWYWWAVFYRNSIFSKHNITPPKTFNDLYKVCDTLKSSGVVPFVVGAQAPWTLAGWFDILNMRINGPQFHLDLTGGKAHYTDAKVKQVFSVWKDMIKRGYFTKSASAYTWDQQVPPLLKGEGGMYLIGRFIYNSFPADAQPDLNFFSFPTYNSAIPSAEEAPVDGFFMPQKAKNVQAGKDFLTYLGSVDGQKLFVTDGAEALAANDQVPSSAYKPFDVKGVEFIKQAKFVTQFYDRDTDTTVSTRGMAFFGQFFSNPDMDVNQGLSDLDQFAQTVYSK